MLSLYDNCFYVCVRVYVESHVYERELQSTSTGKSV